MRYFILSFIIEVCLYQLGKMKGRKEVHQEISDLFFYADDKDDAIDKVENYIYDFEE